MATWVVVISLALLVGLCVYWEFRYRRTGLGRGWMRGPIRLPDRSKARPVDPGEVWGPVRVHRAVYDWESRGDFDQSKEDPALD